MFTLNAILNDHNSAFGCYFSKNLKTTDILSTIAFRFYTKNWRVHPTSGCACNFILGILESGSKSNGQYTDETADVQLSQNKSVN